MTGNGHEVEHRNVEHGNVEHSNVERLERQLSDMQESVAERTAARHRRRRAVVALGAAVAVLSVWSLSMLTALTGKLDAEAVVQIARLELQRHLPSGRRAYQDYLEQEAPRLTRETLLALIDSLPELRRYVVRDLSEKLEVINGQFEDRLVAQMGETIHASKAMIDEAHPDVGDRAKLERLIAMVADDFGSNLNTATQGLYLDYSAEMSRITESLRDLQSADPARLSEDQRTVKEIITTLLQLVLTEHAGAAETGAPETGAAETGAPETGASVPR